MLENPNENFHTRFKIRFGNLKEDIKDNYYLATDERAYENKIVTCLFFVEKGNNKYAMIEDNFMGINMVKYLNLDCFEEWNYVRD
jgi:hypothetical protein